MEHAPAVPVQVRFLFAGRGPVKNGGELHVSPAYTQRRGAGAKMTEQIKGTRCSNSLFHSPKLPTAASRNVVTALQDRLKVIKCLTKPALLSFEVASRYSDLIVCRKRPGTLRGDHKGSDLGAFDQCHERPQPPCDFKIDVSIDDNSTIQKRNEIGEHRRLVEHSSNCLDALSLSHLRWVDDGEAIGKHGFREFRELTLGRVGRLPGFEGALRLHQRVASFKGALQRRALSATRLHCDALSGIIAP